MILCFLLLTAILEAFSLTTNLDGQLFFFPEESITSYVILKPNLTAPTKSFTVCLRALTELTRDYSLFSGNNPEKENDLLLFYWKGFANPYSIYIGGQGMSFRTLGSTMGRNHICVTWESSTGVAQLWLNGNPSVRKVMQKGYSIQKNLMVTLGQEQDSYGGSFDKNQSFVGEIGDVHLWDYVLSPTDILQAMCNNRHLNGNIISWRALLFEMKGDAIIVPVQQRGIYESRACAPLECREK